jgi:hypothetical protein
LVKRQYRSSTHVSPPSLFHFSDLKNLEECGRLRLRPTVQADSHKFSRGTLLLLSQSVRKFQQYNQVKKSYYV